ATFGHNIPNATTPIAMGRAVSAALEWSTTILIHPPSAVKRLVWCNRAPRTIAAERHNRMVLPSVWSTRSLRTKYAVVAAHTRTTTHSHHLSPRRCSTHRQNPRVTTSAFRNAAGVVPTRTILKKNSHRKLLGAATSRSAGRAALDTSVYSRSTRKAARGRSSAL